MNFLRISCKFIDYFYAGFMGLCYTAAKLHHNFLKGEYRNKLTDDNFLRLAAEERLLSMLPFSELL
jgi:hypothetical protein